MSLLGQEMEGGKGGTDRALIVTRNFPPTAGGMERLLFHCYQELLRDYEMAVVAPAAADAYLARGTSFRGFDLTPLALSILSAHWQAWRLAKNFHPALVLAGSGVMAPAALVAARTCGARTACYLHGLDVIARDTIYQSIFVRSLRHFDVLIANSRATRDCIRDVVDRDVNVEILNPGVTIPTNFSSRPTPSLRRRLGVSEGCRILLSVGRLTERKGLVEFVSWVLPELLRVTGEVRLVIIGEEPQNSLKKSHGVKKKIEKAAKEYGALSNIHFVGRVDDNLLSQAYAEADLLVFPVKRIPGDMEGFGMVSVEAAAHGLPTIAFDEGGIRDSLKDGVSGCLIRSGDYKAFFRAIVLYLSGSGQERERWRNQCQTHAKGFSWENFGVRLRDICRNLINTGRLPIRLS
jgi:phosphatidylinositol alpha-1,6-mannosyltransferase